jgi:hypothetical protein
MTTIIHRNLPRAASPRRTAPYPPAAEQRSTRRRRRVQRGVVASYLHNISARHTPTAPAV